MHFVCFITASKTARYASLSWSRHIQSTTSHHILIKFPSSIPDFYRIASMNSCIGDATVGNKTKEKNTQNTKEWGPWLVPAFACVLSHSSYSVLRSGGDFCFRLLPFSKWKVPYPWPLNCKPLVSESGRLAISEHGKYIKHTHISACYSIWIPKRRGALLCAEYSPFQINLPRCAHTSWNYKLWARKWKNPLEILDKKDMWLLIDGISFKNVLFARSVYLHVLSYISFCHAKLQTARSEPCRPPHH